MGLDALSTIAAVSPDVPSAIFVQAFGFPFLANFLGCQAFIVSVFPLRDLDVYAVFEVKTQEFKCVLSSSSRRAISVSHLINRHPLT